MLIHLDQVLRQPVSWQETVQVSVAELGLEDVLEIGPVTWSGRVTRTEVSHGEATRSGSSRAEPGYYLRAHLEYEQRVACHRCLAPVEMPVAADVDLLLLRDAPQPLEGEHELEEEDLGVVHVEGETFDTGPLLREQLQLGVPMKPLCREDCRGLCPQCGADRNRGDCDCKDDWADPRWAALADLKTD